MEVPQGHKVSTSNVLHGKLIIWVTVWNTRPKYGLEPVEFKLVPLN